MKEVTIEITTYCPEKCDYCSTKASDKNVKNLSFENIKAFIDRESPDIINISGGEPLAHPQFYKILTYCQEVAEVVWLYTNAVSNIRFNSDIHPKGIKTHANTVVREGSINIPPADKVHLLELKEHGRAKNNQLKPVKATMSGHGCSKCNHKVLQANNKETMPCRKEY